MKSKFNAALAALVCSVIGLQANAQSISSIEDYNKQLPFWGVSWAPGAGAINGYYPTFYTGFAMRQQAPEKIHVRLSRGNQSRVSVILDETTIQDYLFDLVKRNNVYNKLNSSGVININPSGGKMLPQLNYFGQIIDSPVYGIAKFVEEAKAGRATPEQVYAKSLEVLTALNPGRVFPIKIDLNQEFLKWRAGLASVSSEGGTILALNSLLWGRINYTEKPSNEILAKFAAAVEAAPGEEAKFLAAAQDLFKALTGSKYKFKVLENGRFVDALRCSAASCTLTYPEFTAIYPTGTAIANTTDENGNRINRFATPGLWMFRLTGDGNVDNIRVDDPYYGFAPKMDYQKGGNGYHNPAVRFNGGNFPASAKKALGTPMDHVTLWAVKRGDVSHGCSRLPLGHLWEMRQIFPVENARMTQIHFFGNDSRDFDVYDIDGNGQAEIMGVEYTISYNLQGTSGLQRREGSNFEMSNDKKEPFYRKLYGANNVFTIGNNSQVLFEDPNVSVHSYMDALKFKVSVRTKVKGTFSLYEQAYERDKVQFYSSGGVKRNLHRLMGRVRGCAPTSDKAACGEASFDKEAQAFIRN